jgi:hypothetical protein
MSAAYAWAFMIAMPMAPVDDLERFVGEWRGDSTCVAKNTACRDETVIYRIAKIPEKSGYLSVSADKIVNGNAVNMGTLEFRYDQDRDLLICEYSQGRWQFKVDGRKMEGTLTRADNSVFRSVILRKEP